MTLIVEDGTIVADANSYVSEAEYQAYATARGLTIGSTTEEREQELTKAMDFLDSYRDSFKGYKNTRDQSTQWPRQGVFIDGFQQDSNTLPVELKKAQMELAVTSRSFDLAPNQQYQNIASQKLDTLAVSYHAGGTYQSVQLGGAQQFLDELLINRNGNLAVRA
jgi:flagellar biosynthesis regulator FlaF